MNECENERKMLRKKVSLPNRQIWVLKLPPADAKLSWWPVALALAASSQINWVSRYTLFNAIIMLIEPNLHDINEIPNSR